MAILLCVIKFLNIAYIFNITNVSFFLINDVIWS